MNTARIITPPPPISARELKMELLLRKIVNRALRPDKRTGAENTQAVPSNLINEALTLLGGRG